MFDIKNTDLINLLFKRVHTLKSHTLLDKSLSTTFCELEKYFQNKNEVLIGIIDYDFSSSRRKIKNKMTKGKNKMTKEDRLLAFKHNIIEGPNFVCHSCNRCLFIKSVRILSDLQLKNLKNKLDTPFLKAISFEKLQKSKQSILCINCLKLIRKKKIPSTSMCEGNGILIPKLF